MAAWLIAAIERLPPRARRVVVVAATAVLLLAGAIASLTLEAGRGGAARRSTWPCKHRRGEPRRGRCSRACARRFPGSDLRLADRLARRFLRLVSAVRLRQGKRWVGEGRHARAAQPADRGSALSSRRPSAAADPRVVSLATVGTNARVRRRDGDDRGRRDRCVSAAVCAPGRGRPVVGERCAGGVSRDGGRDPPARRPRADGGGGRVPAPARGRGGAADGRDRRDLHRQRRR